MARPFREHHLITLFEGFDNQSLPLDLLICRYFRNNPALGSKDRAFIAETAYTLIRWQGLLDHLIEKPPSWEKRLEIFQSIHLDDYLLRSEIPIHIRYSFPKVLFELIEKSHGTEKGAELCYISNFPAPTTVRANSLKITRDELLKKWDDLYDVTPCQTSEHGIIFHKKINFFNLPDFQGGLFEVQDEGSQLLAKLVDVQPGQLVMDYCAGSGGKTLAFAPKMENRGQIFLHDIRPHALEESKKRLRRAGIQNSQLVHADDLAKLKKLKKKMNWVLVDAPCTGTGTMRRNPDMKWKFAEDTVYRLVGQQRTIFEKALSYLHPEGRIVYATCSILNEENQGQVDHFLATYNLEVEGEIFQTLPSKDGMDGFFGVVMKKRSQDSGSKSLG